MFRQLKCFLKFRKQEMLLQSAAIGMNSSVDIARDRHIVMLDYDVKDRDVVVRSIEELQRFWNLSDAYVFSTKNGFHVMLWYDIIPYSRLVMIINYAADVDPMFKQISRFYLHKTLRVEGKHPYRDIKFSGIVRGVRAPTGEEWEIGELKRKEHLMLVDPQGFAKDKPMPFPQPQDVSARA
jgi:hypothetical protein